MNKIKTKKNVTKPGTILEVALSIPQVRLTKFFITEYGYSIKTVYTITHFEYEMTARFDIDEQGQNMSVSWDIILRDNVEVVPEGEKKKVIAEISSFSMFHASTFDHFKKIENKYLIPDDLLNLMLTNSLSNTRGMLIAKLENTFFSNAIIPLADTRVFIKNMFSKVN